MWITPKEYDFKKYVSCPNFPYCGKCGEYIYKQPKVTIFVSNYNKHTGQHQRKLCAICNSCYNELLCFLEVPDVL